VELCREAPAAAALAWSGGIRLPAGRPALGSPASLHGAVRGTLRPAVEILAHILAAKPGKRGHLAPAALGALTTMFGAG